MAMYEDLATPRMLNRDFLRTFYEPACTECKIA